MEPLITTSYLVGLLTGEFADVTHTHSASDITSGVVDPARLGTGTSITTKYLRGDGTWQTVATSTAWGGITGTLSDQTDLQTALNAKASLSGATFTGTVVVPGSGQIDSPGTGVTRHFGSTDVHLQANSGSVVIISAGATTLSVSAGVSTFENPTSFDTNATVIVNGRGTQLADLLELDAAGTSTGNAMRVMNGATEVAKWTKTGAITQDVLSGSSDPTTSTFASGKGGWYHNTTANETRFWRNIGGTMYKSAALTT